MRILDEHIRVKLIEQYQSTGSLIYTDELDDLVILCDDLGLIKAAIIGNFPNFKLGV